MGTLSPAITWFRTPFIHYFHYNTSGHNSVSMATALSTSRHSRNSLAVLYCIGSHPAIHPVRYKAVLPTAKSGLPSPAFNGLNQFPGGAID